MTVIGQKFPLIPIIVVENIRLYGELGRGVFAEERNINIRIEISSGADVERFIMHSNMPESCLKANSKAHSGNQII